MRSLATAPPVQDRWQKASGNTLIATSRSRVVSGAVNLAHTAFADLGGDGIGAEGGAGLKGHGLRDGHASRDDGHLA